MPLGPVQPNSRHRYGPGAEYVVTKVPMGKSTVTGYYHDDKENCPPFGAKKGVDAQPSIDDIVANWKTRALKSATKAPKKRTSVSRTRKQRRSNSCPPENAAPPRIARALLPKKVVENVTAADVENVAAADPYADVDESDKILLDIRPQPPLAPPPSVDRRHYTACDPPVDDAPPTAAPEKTAVEAAVEGLSDLFARASIAFRALATEALERGPPATTVAIAAAAASATLVAVSGSQYRRGYHDGLKEGVRWTLRTA